MIRTSALVLATALSLASLTACDDDSEPDESDITGFLIQSPDEVVIEWYVNFSLEDTIWWTSGQEVPAEIRWYTDDGERVRLSSDAEVTVTSTSPASLTWVADADDESQGTFVIPSRTDEVVISMRIALTVDDETILETPPLPVRLFPSGT